MWQKFRKREEAIKAYYKDKGEPARDHLPRTAVDGVISWEPVSMHWNIILSLHLETMPCWVWLQVCQRKERSCQDVIIPPHPTPPNLETMPCWVWLQVCQRKERNCQDVIIPPHPTPPHPPASGDDAMLSVATSVSEEGTQLPGRYYPTPLHPTHPTPLPRIWRRCHVECGRKCVRGRNAAARTLLSHPTPPHPPASGDDAMLSVAASVTEEGTHLPGRYYPTPPHRIWRRCHVECGHKCVRGRNAAARTSLSDPTAPHPPHPNPPHLETMPCWVWPQVCQRKERSCQDVIIPPHPTPPRIWRRCYVDCGRNCDADVGFWVVRMVVGEWPFFGCEILLFWLRNRLFLVAESPFFGCEIK